MKSIQTLLPIFIFKEIATCKESKTALFISVHFQQQNTIFASDGQEKRYLCWIVANVLDCDVVVSEFEMYSQYYVHSRTNTIGKSRNSLKG